MTLMTNFDKAQFIQNASSVLMDYQRAMARIQQMYAFTLDTSLVELEAAPANMATSDAQNILTALADANGHVNLWNIGTDSRNVGPGYVYGNSSKVVIGPQPSS